MKRAYTLLLLLTLTIGASAQEFGYKWQRVLMDSSWDRNNEPQIESIIGRYKPVVDSLMNRVVGVATHELRSFRPQSSLSNFTTDAMMEYTKLKGIEEVDFALTNFGGLRAALPKGDIKMYTLFSIYPFKNYLVTIDLKGELIFKLFSSFAKNRVEATSSNVRYSIRKGALQELFINGKKVEPSKIYRVLTIDFLLDGGDNLTIFKEADKSVHTNILLRDAIVEVIENRTKMGKKISAPLDNRVKIIN